VFQTCTLTRSPANEEAKYKYEVDRMAMG